VIGFNGRIDIRVYIRAKPVPWGLLVRKLADSLGYVLRTDVFSGKQEARGDAVAADDSQVESVVFGEGYDCVKRLVVPTLSAGCLPPLSPGLPYRVWTDCFYTSIPLAQFLRSQGMYLTGVIAANRAGVPDFISGAEVTHVGDYVYCVRADAAIVVTKWRDVSNEVIYLSAWCAPVPVGGRDTLHLERWQAGHSERTSVVAPPVAAEYRTHMGSVDRADQHVGYYKLHRRSTRWWLTLFDAFLDMDIVNCWLISHHWQNVQSSSRQQLAFRLELVRALLAQGTEGRSRAGRAVVPDAVRYNWLLGHWPRNTGSRLGSRCACGCGAQPYHVCSVCGVSLHYDCFERFHSK
jgi:hypothetical protein